MRSVIVLLVSGVLAVASLGASPAHAAGSVVCDSAFDVRSGTWIKVNCRTVDEPTGGRRQSGQGGAKPPPMVWIRMGVYSAGMGFSAPACRLVSSADPIPSDHYQTTGAECGLQGSMLVTEWRSRSGRGWCRWCSTWVMERR